MGKSSKRKGAAYELRVVRYHEDEAIGARKVPLSGALAEYPGDVIVADRYTCEVKARKAANGFKKVRDWLGDNDFLFLQEIGQGGPGGGSPMPVVAMPWARYLTMLRAELALEALEAMLFDPHVTRRELAAVICAHKKSALDAEGYRDDPE